MPHADRRSHSDSPFRVMVPAETDSWKAFDLGYDTDRLSYEIYQYPKTRGILLSQCTQGAALISTEGSH